MLNIFLVCGIAFGWILLDSTPSMAQGDARAVDQVTSLVARYDSSWNRKDTVAVSRLMASGYQYFTSLGGVRPRAAILEFLGSPEYVLEHAQRSELLVTRAGPVAVVSSRWKGHGTYRARRFVDDQRCGQVWLQIAGTWRILSEHCVQIVPDPWAASE
jgi:ketosteroid isomerase-like protein